MQIALPLTISHEVPAPESVRERLIREGSIIPAPRDVVLERLLEIQQILLESPLKKIVEERIRLIRDAYILRMSYYYGCSREMISGCNNKIASFVYYVLTLKRLNILIEEFAMKIGGSRTSNSIYRSGFFFSFKENKRNNP